VPWFEYEGHCPNGTAMAGRIEAETFEDAREMLTENMRLSLSDIREAKAPPPAHAIGQEEFIFFNEQLASLASAGMALDEGLQQLAKDVQSPKLKGFIEAVVQDLQAGASLEQTIGRHEDRLPVLYSRIIRAGIQTGRLPAMLLNLNQHLRLMGETRRILWETLSYPILVLGLAFTIMSGFFLFVVPQFRMIFADFGIGLPSLTELVLRTSLIYPTILMTGCIVIPAMIIAWRLLRFTCLGRLIRESIAAHLPIVGRVYRESLLSRFVKSMSLCIQAGLTLPDALRLAGDVTGSRVLCTDAEHVAAAAERGESVLNATQLCRFIPSIVGYTLQVAVGRDALPAALMQLSRSYESRAVHLQSMLRTILLPIAILIIGFMIGLIVLALFLPLASFINAVSGGGY